MLRSGVIPLVLVILGKLGRVVLVSVRLVGYRLARVAIILSGGSVVGNGCCVLTLTAHVLQVSEVEHFAQRWSALVDGGDRHLASLDVLVAVPVFGLRFVIALRQGVHVGA